MRSSVVKQGDFFILLLSEEMCTIVHGYVFCQKQR